MLHHAHLLFSYMFPVLVNSVAILLINGFTPLLHLETEISGADI